MYKASQVDVITGWESFKGRFSKAVQHQSLNKQKEKHFQWFINLYDRGLSLESQQKSLREMNINICYASVLSTQSNSSHLPPPFTVLYSQPSQCFFISSNNVLSSLFPPSHLFSSYSSLFLFSLSSFPTGSELKQGAITLPLSMNQSFHSVWCSLRCFHVCKVLYPLQIHRVETTWLTKRRGLLMSTHTWRNWRMWCGSWNPQLSLVKEQTFIVLIRLPVWLSDWVV